MNHLFTPLVESLNSSQVALSRQLSPELSSGLEYHELGLRRPSETNVLEELKSNLDQLEDLHSRLKYMMSEIGQVTRKRS